MNVKSINILHIYIVFKQNNFFDLKEYNMLEFCSYQTHLKTSFSPFSELLLKYLSSLYKLISSVEGINSMKYLNTQKNYS